MNLDYQMKSFVSYFGTNPNAGHYVATLSFGGKFLQLSDQVMTVCDDITRSSDCYLVVYQKTDQGIAMHFAESRWLQDWEASSLTQRPLQRSDTLPIIPEIHSSTHGVRNESSETIQPFSQQKSFDKQSSLENYSQENREAAIGQWYEDLGWEDEDIDYNEFWDDYHHLDVQVCFIDFFYQKQF